MNTALEAEPLRQVELIRWCTSRPLDSNGLKAHEADTWFQNICRLRFQTITISRLSCPNQWTSMPCHFFLKKKIKNSMPCHFKLAHSFGVLLQIQGPLSINHWCNCLWFSTLLLLLLPWYIRKNTLLFCTNNQIQNQNLNFSYIHLFSPPNS